jgi:hypothetical protein
MFEYLTKKPRTRLVFFSFPKRIWRNAGAAVRQLPRLVARLRSGWVADEGGLLVTGVVAPGSGLEIKTERKQIKLNDVIFIFIFFVQAETIKETLEINIKTNTARNRHKINY